MDIKELRAEYKKVIGKGVPIQKINDESWILEQLEEANEEIIETEPVEIVGAETETEAEIMETDIPLNMGRGVKKGETVEIYEPNGNLLRVYSLAVHGKNYLKNAQSFCSKKEYEKFAI